MANALHNAIEEAVTNIPDENKDDPGVYTNAFMVSGIAVIPLTGDVIPLPPQGYVVSRVYKVVHKQTNIIEEVSGIAQDECLDMTIMQAKENALRELAGAAPVITRIGHPQVAQATRQAVQQGGGSPSSIPEYHAFRNGWPFGKQKGKRLMDVSLQSLCWFVIGYKSNNPKYAELDDKRRLCVLAELERRGYTLQDIERMATDQGYEVQQDTSPAPALEPAGDNPF